MKTSMFTLVFGLTLLTATSHAQFTVDGVVEGAYGSPLATDDTIPVAGEGGGDATPILDLANLYVGSDSTNLYIAVTIAGDIVATNWGKYIILINSPGITGTGTGAAWGRADNSASNFQIATWVDASTGTQFFKWDSGTTAWAAASGSALVGNAAVPGVVETSVALSDLGNPASVAIAAYSTGGGIVDPAIDAIPGANGNSTWGSTTTLTNFATYSLVAASADSWACYE